MAKKQSSNKDLQWGWTPVGEFYINLVVMVTGQDGTKGAVPLEVFLLTGEELDALRSSLSGVVLAKTLPPSPNNGGRLN